MDNKMNYYVKILIISFSTIIDKYWGNRFLY